ncbi:MAG: 1,4-alpha-glucan branching protein GlgB [Nitrososphaerota archaeon]|nr:1,4-alpha-glucan branching protein GlgB [Nitrososphaerota archaeon]
MSASWKEKIEAIASFREYDPSSILGPHPQASDSISILAFIPRAKRAKVELASGKTYEMSLVDSRGFWSVELPSSQIISDYRITYEDSSGYVQKSHDAYAFPPFLSEYDLHLFSEGTHRKIYEKMGAHIRKIGSVSGVNFTIWAPNAMSVSVVGNFNHWNVGETPMNSRGSSGIWEIFVPEIDADEVYKFAIKSRVDEVVRLKSDPYAFAMEVRPRTAAIATDLDSYEWESAAQDFKNDLDGPISIYEVHPGSWRRKPDGGYLSYRELAGELIPYVKNLGFTHIELLPVMEHPLDDSWGYQVVNYFAPTSRFGTPSDFMYFVDMCHKSNIGVILDWVPSHFPKDEYGLGLFDGTHLYEHADPRRGEQPDWGTLIFNYSRTEVREFLISNALFWLEKYRVDGLRLDAVASMLYLDYSRRADRWLPNRYGGRENLEAVDFLRELSKAVHSLKPNSLLIAEESTAWPGVTGQTEKGGLGMDLKWNMGWMHDTLQYFSNDPVFRKYHQGNLTFGLLYAFSEKFTLVMSHDEVVYGKRSLFNKMPGDDWQKFANLRLLYGFMYGSPGKKLLFMGSEFGQPNEWNFRTGLEWSSAERERNQKLSNFLKDLNLIYSSKKALQMDFTSDGFEWIDFRDSDQSIVSFIRKSRDSDEFLVFVFNMTPVPRYDYRIGVPVAGYYKEILNSDALEYGGSGVGNLGGLQSEDIEWQSRPNSIRTTLPPLAVEVFEYFPSRVD